MVPEEPTAQTSPGPLPQIELRTRVVSVDFDQVDPFHFKMKPCSVVG